MSKLHIHVNIIGYNMKVPISEMTIFYSNGDTQKFTGTYDIHDTYISIQTKEKRLSHDFIIPIHVISGFKATVNHNVYIW